MMDGQLAHSRAHRIALRLLRSKTFTMSEPCPTVARRMNENWGKSVNGRVVLMNLIRCVAVLAVLSFTTAGISAAANPRTADGQGQSDNSANADESSCQ